MSDVPPVPQQQQHMPHYQPQYGPTEPQTSKLAIAAFICGLVFCIPILTPLAAVTLGVIALIVIASSNGRTKGNGFALSGIILGLLVGVGQIWMATSAFGLVTEMASGPARRVMKGLEDKAYSQVRNVLATGADQVTDEQLDAFRSIVEENCGKLISVGFDWYGQGLMASPQAGNMTNPFAPNMNAAQVFPISLEFENGTFIGAIDLVPNPNPPTNPNFSNIFKVSNVSIIINSNPVRMIPVPATNAPNGAPDTDSSVDDESETASEA